MEARCRGRGPLYTSNSTLTRNKPPEQETRLDNPTPPRTDALYQTGIMNSIQAPYVGGLMGVALHHGLFIHGEWHVQAPQILMIHLVSFLYLIVNVPTSWQIISGYLLGLFSSILSYRLFFHRLNGFPGPRWASVSKIWHLWKTRRSQNHFFMAKLHAQYGDFVRTGPSEITVFHPDVFMAVDGPRSKCMKGEWYDLLHPDRSLVNARTSDIHRPRRRVWMQGFTSKGSRYDSLSRIHSLTSYSTRRQRRTDPWLD